jgi:serine/threonine protein kinase
LDLIRGEVAILKKLNHPNIVKLYEVLDIADGDSMYMGKVDTRRFTWVAKQR